MDKRLKWKWGTKRTLASTSWSDNFIDPILVIDTKELVTGKEKRNWSRKQQTWCIALVSKTQEDFEKELIEEGMWELELPLILETEGSGSWHSIVARELVYSCESSRAISCWHWEARSVLSETSDEADCFVELAWLTLGVVKLPLYLDLYPGRYPWSL